VQAIRGRSASSGRGGMGRGVGTRTAQRPRQRRAAGHDRGRRRCRNRCADRRRSCSGVLFPRAGTEEGRRPRKGWRGQVSNEAPPCGRGKSG
jgi:hypothetical protein